MTLQELIKKDIDRLSKDELVVIFDKIHQLHKQKENSPKPQSLREIQKMTAVSTSNWSDDVICDRQNNR